MQIVINKSYGTFGLSIEAFTEYCHRKGIDITFYKFDNVKNTYEKIVSKKDELYLSRVAFNKDYGDSFSLEECKTFEKGSILFDMDINRDDKDLVDIIKIMGDKANGEYAKLCIVNIPDDVNWQISEHDGFEHIEEVHRIWK